jgi:predicted ester cyclase
VVSQVSGIAAAQLGIEDCGMTSAQSPLEIYRRFQSYLLSGEFARLGEVADMDGYTENCVGLTGWTTGLVTALQNYQANVASAFSGMTSTEEDVIEADDTLVIRSVITATHSGEFMGIPATGLKVTYDAVDMFRIKDSLIVWRFLICDWKSVTTQLTAAR